MKFASRDYGVKVCVYVYKEFLDTEKYADEMLGGKWKVIATYARV